MDFWRSFSFMLGQRNWIKKVAIGGLLLLVPIVGWLFVAGYGVKLVRDVAGGTEELPEWAEWGDLLTQGLFVFVAGLIYGIPGAIVARMGDPGAILSSLWGIAATVVFPAAVIRFALKADLGAFFDFNEILGFIRENLSDYVIVVLLVIVANALAGLGVVLLVVGVVFTFFWASLVGAHLCGTLAARAGLPTRI